MKHYDEDTLLKASLNVLELEESAEVMKHLETCTECRRKYAEIKKGNTIITGYEPIINKAELPLPKTRRPAKYGVLKAAAILLAGFGIGYMAGNLNRPLAVNITKQTLVAKAQLSENQDYIHSEVLDLKIDLGF